VGLLGRGEDEQIVDQATDAAYLGLHQTLDPAHLAVGERLLGDQHIELAPHHGEWSPKLVRGVGDELALAFESLRESIEHVVERFG